MNLVQEILPLVSGAERRRRRRGRGEMQKLEMAVGAVVGGVLWAALHRGVAVYRPMERGGFDGAVGYQAARVVMDWLAENGLVHRQPGIRYLRDAGEGERLPAGRATRLLVADGLRDLAARHGITAETVNDAFPRRYPPLPPRVPHPLKITALDATARVNRGRGGGGGGGGVMLPIPRTAEAATLRREVDLANDVFGGCQWSGCQPPRVYRTFRRDFGLVGRWMVAGGLTIQMMPKVERLAIQMDGRPVAEVDASASQLSILAAAAGITQLSPAPYEVAGHDRATVKAAVVATLGAGWPISRWPRRMLERNPALAGYDCAPLMERLVRAFPFLADPGAVLGVERRLVSHRLQRIEAEILTRAMVPFWHERVPVVPIHDGLLCPADEAERARAALVAAYQEHGRGAVVGVTIRR